MAGEITQTDLQNAKLDATTLAEAVTTNAVVTPRTGSPFSSIPKLVADKGADLDAETANAARWAAETEDTEVSSGLFSALHYAAKASDSADAAAASAASVIETNLGPHADDASAEAYATANGTLATGDLYFNTTSNVQRYYTGSGWVTTGAPLATVGIADGGTGATTRRDAKRAFRLGLESLTQLKALTAADLEDDELITVLGYASAGDGGAGAYVYLSGDQSSLVVRRTNTAASVDTVTDTITCSGSHQLVPGDAVLATAAELGLSTDTYYYARRISNTELTLHPTRADAIANTNKVSLTGSITSLTLQHVPDDTQSVLIPPSGAAKDGSEGLIYRAGGLDGFANARWFNAMPASGAVDVSAEMQAAVHFLTVGGTLYIPADVQPYTLASPVHIFTGGITIKGAGMGYRGGTDFNAPTEINFTGDSAFIYGNGYNRVYSAGGEGIILRGGGIRDIWIEDTGATASAKAIFLDDTCSHMTFWNVGLYNSDNLIYEGQSCFSNVFVNCVFDSPGNLGLRIGPLSHSNKVDSCRFVGAADNSGTDRAVVIGGSSSGEHASQCAIVNTSFDMSGVQYQIFANNVRALSLVGVYSEFKDNNISAILAFGNTVASADAFVDGASITGCYFLGNSGTLINNSPVILALSHTGVDIRGCEVRGFDGGVFFEDRDTTSARAGTTEIGRNAYDSSITTVIDNSTGPGVVAREAPLTDGAATFDTVTAATSLGVDGGKALIETDAITIDETDSGNNAIRLLAGATGGRLDVYNGGSILHTIAGTGVTEFNVSNSALDWKVNGTTENLLFCDTGLNQVYIGQGTGAYKLDVNGDVNVTTGNAYRVAGTAVINGLGAAIADLNQTISATPTQAEVQAISDKVDAILATMRDLKPSIAT